MKHEFVKRSIFVKTDRLEYMFINIMWLKLLQLWSGSGHLAYYVQDYPRAHHHWRQFIFLHLSFQATLPNIIEEQFK